MNFKKYHVSKNLCLVSQGNSITYGAFDKYTISNNTVTSTGQALLGFKCKVEPNTSYTISIKKNTSADLRIREYNSEPTDWFAAIVIQSVNTSQTTAVITTTQNTTWILVVFWFAAAGNTVYDIMFNEGSQPLPYEPYDSEVWHDIPHYIHNTSTDTLTTLPAVLYPNDTTATVGLKGQMEQSSQPSPTNPIQPSECGERTENLLDESTAEDTKYYINNIGELVVGSNDDRFIAQKVTVTPSTEYTFSWGDTILGTEDNSPYIRVAEYANTQFLGRVAYKCIDYVNKTFTISTAQYTTVLDIRYDSSTSSRQQTITNLMLNTGSTPLPYEPYGYKIPILSNSTTTPVYLGEVQSTRQIKKLVLTGEEGFTEVGSGGIFRLPLDGYLRQSENIPYCTHYSCTAPVSATNQIPNTTIAFLVSVSGNNYLYIRDDTYINSVTNFKAYLAQQYTNSTPVCIWYVLATPQTAVINEPLRKIGDYADEVSGITIPTIAGANTVDVLTTLKPSEVSVNYHGWHPVQNVHERENGAWT